MIDDRGRPRFLGSTCRRDEADDESESDELELLDEETFHAGLAAMQGKGTLPGSSPLACYASPIAAMLPP